MTAEKCPDCGAAVAPDASKCDYCGAAIAASHVDAWVSASLRLPERSPENPDHSIMVMTCRTLPEDGTPNGTKTSKAVYQGWFRAAYYDFKTRTWRNDSLAIIHDILDATHWRRLPSATDPAWMPVSSNMPAIAPEDNNRSAFALTALIENGGYTLPLTSSIFLYKQNNWYFHIDTTQGFKLMMKEVTHWMPQPAPPTT